MGQNGAKGLNKADVEPLLNSLGFHRGREAHVRELMRQKLEQSAGEADDEMDDGELDHVAGGLHLPQQNRDPFKK